MKWLEGVHFIQIIRKFDGTIVKTNELKVGRSYTGDVGASLGICVGFVEFEADFETRAAARIFTAASEKTSSLPGAWQIIVELRRRRRWSPELRCGEIMTRSFARVTVFLRSGQGEREIKDSCVEPLLSDITTLQIDKLIDALYSTSVETAKSSTIDAINGPIVIRPKVSSVIVHEMFGHGLEADNVLQWGGLPRTLSSVSGLSIPKFTVTECYPGESGITAAYDDDGNPQFPGVLFEDGKVQSLIGRQSDEGNGIEITNRAHQENLQSPVLGRLSNLMMVGHSPNTMLKSSVTKGWMVETASFGRINHRTGLVSLGVECIREISGGTLGPLRLGNVINVNLIDLLESFIAVGDTPEVAYALCDKKGQRVPVTSSAPYLLLDGGYLRKADCGA